jgi:hypothetical protein
MGLGGKDRTRARPVVHRKGLAKALTEAIRQEPREKVNPRTWRP